MADLLEALTSQYDIVLIDTPPLLPVTDAAILAKLTGGALVVAQADKLNRQQLADGMGSLEAVGARVLGVVLNRLSRKQSDAYSYYDYASASGTGTGDETRRKHSRKATSEPTQQRPYQARLADSRPGRTAGRPLRRSRPCSALRKVVVP
jgi:polysaccharide biosynthesis transport protein